MPHILPQQPTRKLTSVSKTSLLEGGKPIPPTLQTILLAEDDALLREVMEAYLGMMGYVVIPCGDAHVASQAFQSSTIDILLTDFQMPGRSGVELARELTQLRPTLPVMIVSGSILPEELISEIQHRNWRFVAKPCSLTSLLQTMQSMLSSDRRHAA